MNLSLPIPAKMTAAVIHAVAVEYRKLDAPPAAAPVPARQELSCTSVQARDTWQPAQRAPASPRAVEIIPLTPKRIGFGRG